MGRYPRLPRKSKKLSRLWSKRSESSKPRLNPQSVKRLWVRNPPSNLSSRKNPQESQTFHQKSCCQKICPKENHQKTSCQENRCQEDPQKSCRCHENQSKESCQGRCQKSCC